MQRIVLLCLFLVVLFNCKSQQYSLDDLPEKQLIFGRGGGVTGEVITYTVLENGQVFYANSLTEEHKEIKSLSKKEAQSCFQKMKVLELSDMNFDHPGNLYYFLEEANGDERYRVTWGSNNHEVAEQCKVLYEELRTSIK